MEAAMGGEFFMYMQSRPTAIPEDAARFYAAAVVLGLEYMQRHDLVWRHAPLAPSSHKHPSGHACARERGSTPAAAYMQGEDAATQCL